MAKYNIGGYIFNDEENAKKAAKELKTVEYILGQIKEADEATVLQIYKKLINQRLFSTEIGLGFLSQLRQNLVASDSFGSEEVPEVYSLEGDAPAENKVEVETVASKESKKESKVKSKKESKKTSKSDGIKTSRKSSNDSEYQIKKLRIINSILIVISISLFLCIVGMFYINSTINSPTILDYEESIIDEYSSWKQELEQKEAELNEREKVLEQLERGQ